MPEVGQALQACALTSALQAEGRSAGVWARGPARLMAARATARPTAAGPEAVCNRDSWLAWLALVLVATFAGADQRSAPAQSDRGRPCNTPPYMRPEAAGRGGEAELGQQQLGIGNRLADRLSRPWTAAQQDGCYILHSGGLNQLPPNPAASVFWS